jgi:hypothetical protein
MKHFPRTEEQFHARLEQARKQKPWPKREAPKPAAAPAKPAAAAPAKRRGFWNGKSWT